MELIIYRKSDGKPLLQEGISSFFTKETYNTIHNYNHVVSTNGGRTKDYSEIWLEDETIIQKTNTHEFKIVDGEIVFGDKKVFDEPPQPPSEIDELTNYVLDVDFRLIMVEMGLV